MAPETLEIEPAKVPERLLEGEVITYRISFEPGQAAIGEGEKGVLARIAEAAKAYPLQRFSLLGLAASNEKDAAKLAEARARAVAKALISKHGVSSARLNVDSGVSMKGQREVEISVEE